MPHTYNVAAIADNYGLHADDLGIELITHETGGVVFESVLVYNKQMPQSTALLAVPNFWGVRQSGIEIAAKTIGAGHAILVTDVYGRDVRPVVVEEARAALESARADRLVLRARMQGALAALQHQSFVPLAADKIGACGFCFGGTAALELARSGAQVHGVVSVHGGLDTPVPDAAAVRSPLLVLHGFQDTIVPRAHLDTFMDEMAAVPGLDWQVVVYGEAGHSFTDPAAKNPGAFYHQQTAERASAALRAFFVRCLG